MAGNGEDNQNTKQDEKHYDQQRRKGEDVIKKRMREVNLRRKKGRRVAGVHKGGVLEGGKAGMLRTITAEEAGDLG